MIKDLHRMIHAVAAVLIALLAMIAMAAPPATAAPADAPAPVTTQEQTTTTTTTPATTTPATTTPTDTQLPTTQPPTAQPPTTSDDTTEPTTPPTGGTGTVTVTAIDLTTHVPISGVGVQLTSGDDVKTVSTTATVEMTAGPVSATVTAVPDGYDRAWVDPSTAELTPGGTASFIVSLNREGRAGAVSITKRDAVTGALLPGARYRVTASRSDQSVVLATGPSGTGAVQVAPGGYDVQEIAAPAGYVLDPTVRFVDIEPSQTRYLELYDSPITPPVVVRNPTGRHPLTSIPTGRTR